MSVMSLIRNMAGDGAGARYEEIPNDRGRLREAASSLGAERLGVRGMG